MPTPIKPTPGVRKTGQTDPNDPAADVNLLSASVQELQAIVAGWGLKTLYVDPVAGNNTRDALTPATAVRTVTAALRMVEDQAQQNDTVATIQLVAGTYTERVVSAQFTSRNVVATIKGAPTVGHPAVPTTVFTEGTSASAVAILSRNPNLVLTVQDVKFVGYRGTTSSGGITVLRASLFAINVHAQDCFYGLSGQHAVLDVKGGVFTNCGRMVDGTGNGAGIRSLMLNRHSIGTQNKGDLSAGPIFQSCVTGIFAQESSTGHADWCTFLDCDNGIIVRVNARVNCDGSYFARCGAAVVVDSNGHAFLSANVSFGTGADANIGTSVVNRSGGNLTSTRFISGVEMAYSRGEQAGDGVYTRQTITGTTAVTDLWNRTLMAPFWGDDPFGNVPPDRVRFEAHGRVTGTGAKELHLRLGAALVTLTIPGTEVGDFVFHGVIKFPEPDRQILAADVLVDGAVGHVKTLAVDVDLTVDQVARVTGKLATAADSIVVEDIEMAWA